MVKDLYMRVGFFKGYEKIEEHYKAKYLGNWCIKTPEGWSEAPVAVFYQPVLTKPEHSHYFGLYWQNERLYITKADTAFISVDVLSNEETGEVIASRYRHHYNFTGNYFIDGGRDYYRGSKIPLDVLEVIEDKFFVNGQEIRKVFEE